jgi:methylenetetrahydrofolate--tRNA-(uracil-5-)-methyltransferase
MIPGLENAEFLRYGQIHRNTYINAPALLGPGLQLRANPNLFFAGQISGVEGYAEAIATGLMAGWNAQRRAEGLEPLHWPRETAHGSLGKYISGADRSNYQPANITFDLLPALTGVEHDRWGKDRKMRRQRQCELALESLSRFLEEHAPVAQS